MWHGLRADVHSSVENRGKAKITYNNVPETGRKRFVVRLRRICTGHNVYNNIAFNSIGRTLLLFAQRARRPAFIKWHALRPPPSNYDFLCARTPVSRSLVCFYSFSPLLPASHSRRCEHAVHLHVYTWIVCNIVIMDRRFGPHVTRSMMILQLFVRPSRKTKQKLRLVFGA